MDLRLQIHIEVRVFWLWIHCDNPELTLKHVLKGEFDVGEL